MSGENRIGMVVVKPYQSLRNLLGDRKFTLKEEKVKQRSLIKSQSLCPWRGRYGTAITLWTCRLAHGFMSGSNGTEQRINKNGKS